MSNPFPKVDEQSAETIIAYQVQSTQRNESIGISRLIELEINRQYYAGNQWNEVAQDTGPFDQAVVPMTQDDKSIPMPVINSVAAIVDGESARLISSTLKPRVDANDRTTRVARAARLAGQVLDDVCIKNSWVRTSHQDRKDTVMFGTSFIATSLDLDVEEMKEVPSPMFGCGCGWKISRENASMEGSTLSVKGPAAIAMGATLPENAEEEEVSRGPISFLNECPECGGEIKEGVAEDTDDVDSFGSSLKKKIPSTRIAIRNVSVYDVCPEGGGRTNDGKLHEYTVESIVPVDWITKRHIKGKEVIPRSLQAMSHLLKWHPAGIDFSGSGGYFGSPAYLSEDRWACYRITVREPFYNTETKKYEADGRLIISANDTVLYHGPLMIHHKKSGRRIPRFMLHPAQYSQVEGSIWGIGAIRRVRKIQDAINTCVAQAQYGRHVWGNPRLWIPQGSGIEYLGQTYGGYQGDSFSFSGDKEPVMHQGQALHPDWHSELSMYFKQIADVSNQADIDRGIPPGGVPSASGLMYLGEQAGTARKPLSQRFAERESQIFRHVLELANATYDTPQQLMVADRGDKRTVKTFTGEDLLWQVDVKVEVQPAFDSAVFRRQATQEAIQSQLLVPSTPLQKRRIAEALGVPPEADMAPSQQIECAENEWIDYALSDDVIEPVVKSRFDDHTIHIEQHFADLRSADGEPLSKFWSMVELACAGWRDVIEGIDQAREELKATPAPITIKQPNVPAGPTGIVTPEAILADTERQMHLQDLQKKIDKLPKNRELCIFQIMAKMTTESPSFSTLDPENQEDALMFVRWLSHIEQHVYEQGANAAVASMGVPQMQAPGGQPEP